MQGKTVLFNLWGGVLIPRPLQIFNKYEDSYGLPRDFVYKAIVPGDSEGALQRAQKGKLMFTQMLSEMEMEFQRAASSQGLSLPPQFSVQELFGKVREDAVLNKPMLEMATKLRRNGLVTCVLANNWVDDSAQREVSARILSALHGYFDLVLQSCHVGARVPEPAMFNLAMQLLNCKPNQAIYLDVVKENLTAAEDFGMTAVSVEDQTEAMKQLQVLSGAELLRLGETFPVCCVPEEVSHGFVTIKPGVETHYVEMGDGPPVLLCHGFPESWYSWRYQIPALADAGFRVLAPDMKGYGNSTAPSDIEEYSQEQLCQGLVTFLDKLGIPQVTLVGHDWGGSLVWNMAQCYPERVRAVASLNTPLFPVDPNTNPMEKLKAMPIFEYQIYFQEPGVAEAELEKDLMRTFKLFFSGTEETGLRLSGVCKRGGLFVGMPEDVPRSSFLTESALEYYVQQYKKTGFGAPLNWYRNMERNWKWICSRPRGKLMMPALMVTAGKDPVLLPVFSTGMENMIPNLTRGHIEDCGHWTQVERPTEVNNILISWLKDIHQKASTPTPKL